jgi:L-asparaginase
MKRLLFFIISTSFVFSAAKLQALDDGKMKIDIKGALDKVRTAKTVGTNPDLPTVVIVSTGGTIAEKNDPETGAAVPALSGNELIKAVPGLLKIANLKVISFSNVDSSRIAPELWQSLSAVVDNILKDPKVKGVVVTHGTDTMAEGSFFLDLTISSKKPVIFVGAMKDASDPHSDGPANLYNAVLQACSPESENWGVTVTMNQYVNSARAVRKTNTTNIQTFESGEKGYLGYISEGKVIKLNERLRRQHLPLPKNLPRVDIFMSYSGGDGSFIRHSVDAGAKGIVVQGVGAGNVNPDIYAAIKYALSKNVAIVITTDVYYGWVTPVYGGQGGGATLKEAGAIMGGDLSARKARILLMLALPLTSKKEELQKFFN